LLDRHWRGWRLLFPVFLAGLLVLISHPEAHADGFGPFSVRNFQPIQLMVLGMPGERASVIPNGALDIRVELAETSTIFDDTTPPITVKMNMEQLRSGVFLRYGLTDRLELGMEIPVLYRYRGFLEGAIKEVERVTSGLAPLRQSKQNAGFDYRVSRNGNMLMSGSDEQLGLGDITLFGKYQLLTENETLPTVSLRLAVKTPSGDSGRFFGSGHTDFGAGVAIEKKLSTHWLVHANVNGIFPTGSIAGLTLQPAMSGIAAVEYLWTPKTSLVLQFDYYSSPFHNTGSPVLDNGVTEMTAGFNYLLRENLLWQVYGIQNLDFIRKSAADFTLATAVTYRFGR
jgi:hypothetical protein